MPLLAWGDQGKNRPSSCDLWLLFCSVKFELFKPTGVRKSRFKHTMTKCPKKRRVGRKRFLKEHGGLLFSVLLSYSFGRVSGKHKLSERSFVAPELLRTMQATQLICFAISSSNGTAIKDHRVNCGDLGLFFRWAS